MAESWTEQKQNIFESINQANHYDYAVKESRPGPTRPASEWGPVVCRTAPDGPPAQPQGQALFSSENWKVFETVALSFVCGKYYLIID